MGRCVDKGGRTGNEAEVGWSAAPIFLGLGTELGLICYLARFGYPRSKTKQTKVISITMNSNLNQ